MSNENFPYLANEDANLCRALRLSETDYLGFHGGIASYTRFRLDRDKARQADYDIPEMSSNIDTYMPTLKSSKLSEAKYAEILIKDLRTKVAGCISAIKATKRIDEYRRLNK